MNSLQSKPFMASGTDTRKARREPVANVDDETFSTDGWLGDPGQKSKSRRSGLFDFRGFALARRIFVTTLIALSVLLFGALVVIQSRNEFLINKQDNLAIQSKLVAQILSQSVAEQTDTVSILAVLKVTSEAIPALNEIEITIFGPNQKLVRNLSALKTVEGSINATADIGMIEQLIQFVNRFGARLGPKSNDDFVATVSAKALKGGTGLVSANSQSGFVLLGIGEPITTVSGVVGSVVLTIPTGLLEGKNADIRNGMFIFYFLAIFLSLFLSFFVARTISNPLHDLAHAAEIGKSAQLGEEERAQSLIPELVGRQDVIGRLSAAMREMINALYDRIDTNERFAADVVHEIKNPLASMRSAVETLRIAKDGPARSNLLDVLQHDVQRLDRMVSDISNASRLDGELVNEETREFDLSKMLERITEFLSMEAREKGVEVIWSAPQRPIMFDGLEERLAQVFVNLITNAVSFCEAGDAVRVWARIRQNRILVVVEDSGVGIPDDSLAKIFTRFYSQRPEKSFGNHSGLGLAISKQIVEAHGGVIWAENIRDNTDDILSEPVGARFIVGLPLS